MGQIAQQNLDGFLVLDLTLVLGLHESLYYVESVDEYEKVGHALYTRVAALSANGEIDRWVRNHRSGQRVFGVAAVAFTTAFVPPTGTLIHVRRWIADGIRRSDNSSQVAFFYDFTRNLR